MDKGAPPSLFVNDGSFMEKFKQLQQEQEKKDAKTEDSKPIKIVSGSLTPNLSISKKASAANYTWKTSSAGSSGKLAFSLKQKSKLVPPPVMLSAEDDEEETDGNNLSRDVPSKRQKMVQEDDVQQSSRRADGGNYFALNFLSSSWLIVVTPAECSFLVFKISLYLCHH